MKKLTYKILSTVISLVLVTTALLGSGDFLFPKVKAHFLSIPGDSTCTAGPTTQGFPVFNGPGESAELFVNISPGLITSVSGVGTSSGTLPSSSIVRSVPTGASGTVFVSFVCSGTQTFSGSYPQNEPPAHFDYTYLFTVTEEVNVPPAISITPANITVVHSDLGAPASTHDYSVSIDDLDSADDPLGDSTIVLAGCGGNWSITGPTDGEDGWSSTLTYTYPKLGPIVNDTCRLEAEDAEGTTLSNIVSFNASDSPPTVSSTCSSVLIATDNGPKSLSQLRSTDTLLVDPTPFTIDYTITDSDDTTIDRTTTPSGPATSVPGVTFVSAPPNPLATGAPQTFSYTLAQGATGRLTETFMNHSTIQSSCSISPTGGRGGYTLEPTFGTNTPDKVTFTDENNIIVTYGSGIKSCVEITYIGEVVIDRTEPKPVDFGFGVPPPNTFPPGDFPGPSGFGFIGSGGFSGGNTF